MPTPTKGRRMGGSAAHQRHMLANLATALFEHGKITTTQARARRLRPVAERLITFAKRGDLHARRQVLTVLTDKAVVKTLFDEIGPSYASRDGGYTRITKVGIRKGDSAPMAVIELVREESAARQRRRRPRRGQVEVAPVAEAESDAQETAADVTGTEEAGTEEAGVTTEASGDGAAADSVGSGTDSGSANAASDASGERDDGQ